MCDYVIVQNDQKTEKKKKKKKKTKTKFVFPLTTQKLDVGGDT
jgi:hypothetical protein